MRVMNESPFAAYAFHATSDQGRPVVVMAVQGTFVVQTGEPMRAAAHQVPVWCQDVYRGVAHASGLRHASAAVVYRPCSDVIVNAVAHAPFGYPAAEWQVDLHVGRLRRQLLVRGPHQWLHTARGGWRREPPTSVASVPLLNEHAFGGAWSLGGRVVLEPRNPIGTGYLPDGVPTSRPIAAPQVVAVNEPEHLAGARYIPRGFAAVPRYFEPRSATLENDEGAEQASRCMGTNAYGRFNASHPDLRYPGFLRGNEPVVLSHARPGGGDIRTALPGVMVCGLLELPRGRLCALKMRLDSLELDVESPDPAEHRAFLVWRGLFPLEIGVQRVALTATSLPDDAAETRRVA